MPNYTKPSIVVFRLKFYYLTKTDINLTTQSVRPLIYSPADQLMHSIVCQRKKPQISRITYKVGLTS